jgi:protein-disulfide isomerase
MLPWRDFFKFQEEDSMTHLKTLFFPALAIFLCAPAIGQKNDMPLALVNGDALTGAELEQREGNHLLQARYQYYQAERKALDELVDQHLLEQEAQRQGVTVDELIKREVDDNVKDPTDDQLQVYYEGMDSKEPYEKMREKILDHIRETRKAKLRAAYIESLRLKANVVIELAPPSAAIQTSNEAGIEGRSDAPVQVVEFADYQCPYCQKVNPDLNKLVQDYAGKVSVIYKDFPLPMHPFAEKAAEAARCAGEQGKFWEYHNLLFANRKLEVADLKQQAKSIRLEEDKFDQCLDSGREAAEIEKDRQEGMNLGLSGTPSFFLNGHFFSGAVDYATLQQMVDQQLTALLSSVQEASPKESSRR